MAVPVRVRKNADLNTFTDRQLKNIDETYVFGHFWQEKYAFNALFQLVKTGHFRFRW